jgi:hypothetical protein
MGPGKGGDPARSPRERRGKGGARRPVRNVVSFSMRLACPRLAGPLLPLAVERDRVLIAAVTRVAVASLGRQRQGTVGRGRPGATADATSLAPYPAAGTDSGGANPRST